MDQRDPLQLEETDLKPPVYTCPKCPNKSFPSRQHLRRHEINIHQNRRYLCFQCPDKKSFTTPQGLQRHMRMIHENKKKDLQVVQEKTVQKTAPVKHADVITEPTCTTEFSDPLPLVQQIESEPVNNMEECWKFVHDKEPKIFVDTTDTTCKIYFSKYN
jgi:hypothetical protein